MKKRLFWVAFLYNIPRVYVYYIRGFLFFFFFLFFHVKNNSYIYICMRVEKKKKKNKSFRNDTSRWSRARSREGEGVALPLNEGDSAPVPVKPVFGSSKRRKLFLCVIYRLRLESGLELKVHQNLHVPKICCNFAAEFKNAYTYGYN